MSYIISVWDETGQQLVTNGNGTHITYHENKQKSYEGQIKNGVANGECTYWYADGTVKEQGKFVDGSYLLNNSFNPKGERMVISGRGYHHTYYDNGVIESEGMFINGKRHGLFLSRSEGNILIAEINYKDGKADGETRYYQETGELLSQGNLKNNLQDGEWTWYHLNGEKESQVTFVDGKKENEQKFWSESGVEVKSEYYKNGELINEQVKY
jgi:uncharacterized protein